MPSEKIPQEFTYQSKLSDVFFHWVLGIVLIWLAGEDLRAGTSWHWGLHLFFDVPYHLLLLAWGCVMLNATADVEILDGQFRFRRLLLRGKSVPLKSITRVRRIWLPPAVYVRLDYAGARYRLIFSPDGMRFFGPPISPVLHFIQEVCKKNTEKSAPQT
jgi:hypothetical protein